MRRKFFIGLLVAGLLPAWLGAASSGENRLGFSLVLSGHLMLGVNVQHFFDAHHALQATVFPLLIPGRKWPFAGSVGYQYYTAGEHWQGTVGAQLAVIVSPPDPQKRKILPMLNVTPGVRYVRDSGQSVGGKLWLSYFLKKTRRKFLPTGVELLYDFVW